VFHPIKIGVEVMIEKKIQDVMDKNIKPYLGKHNGDIKFLGIEDGIVKIRLLGQCSECISAKYTLENVISAALIAEIPEIKKVELLNYISADTLEMARKILNKDM
jgi:Fe-S cluster biogenesis protein NfuA